MYKPWDLLSNITGNMKQERSYHIAEHVFLGKPEETEMLIPYVSLSIYLPEVVASAVE